MAATTPKSTTGSTINEEKYTTIIIVEISDIIIQYKDKRFNCNEAIIKHYSSKFKALLDGKKEPYSKMDAKLHTEDPKRIVLADDNFSSDHLSEILKWMHCPIFVSTRSTELKENNYPEYYYISTKYVMPQILAYAKDCFNKDSSYTCTNSQAFSRWMNCLFLFESLNITKVAFTNTNIIPMPLVWKRLINDGGTFVTTYEALKDTTKILMLDYLVNMK